MGLSLETLPSLIFTEENLERFNLDMFLADTVGSKRLRKVREIDIQPGSPNYIKGVQSTIKIIPSVDCDSYTTGTYNVYLALEQIWRAKGCPIEPWAVSASEIAAEMHFSRNIKSLNRIRRHLNSLNSTQTVFSRCFRVPGEGGAKEVKVLEKEPIHVLSVYKTTEITTSSGRVIHGPSMICFHKSILANLLSGKVRPVNLKARCSLRPGISLAWYTRADRDITGRMKNESAPVLSRTMLGIVKDLYLTANESYKTMSYRKQQATTIAKNLDGIETSMKGVTLKAECLKTKDGTDWKVVLTAVGRPVVERKQKIVKRVNDKNICEGLMIEILRVVGEVDSHSIATFKTVASHVSCEAIFAGIGDLRESSYVISKPRLLMSQIKKRAVDRGEAWPFDARVINAPTEITEAVEPECV